MAASTPTGLEEILAYQSAREYLSSPSLLQHSSNSDWQRAFQQSSQAQLHAQYGPTQPALAAMETFPVEETQAMYLEGYALANKLAQQARKPSTMRSIRKVREEFEEWLHCTAKGYTMANCRPDEIVVFMKLYSERHQGTLLPGGGKIAAPKSMDKAISHLSSVFIDMERRRDWDDKDPARSNPTSSRAVELWRLGYHKDATKKLYRQGSAVPCSQPDLEGVVDHYDQLIEACPNPFKRLVLMQYQLMVLGYWHTIQRGAHVGELELNGLRNAEGNFADPIPLQLPPGYMLLVTMLGTKTEKRPWKARTTIPPEPEGRGKYCFIRRTRAFLAACRNGGHPVTQYLFRNQNRQGNGFSTTFMKPSKFRPLRLVGGSIIIVTVANKWDHRLLGVI